VKISTVRGAPKARVFLVLLACAVALATRAAETDKEKQQTQIRNMAQDTLQRLYKAEPKTRSLQSNTHSAMQYSAISESKSFSAAIS
jgi:hypothetical protein